MINALHTTIAVNDMPDIEKFITDNDLGEFTGFTQRSGFCEYPLYLFNVDKLRELCPDGMDFIYCWISNVTCVSPVILEL